MSIFNRKRKTNPQQVEETKKVIEEQTKTSEATLTFVKKVLDDKDKILAEALNQTGAGLRQRRSPAAKMRPR